jgi:hypothetical protein
MGQPARGRGGHPAQDVQAVRAAVQRYPWLVHPGLRGKQRDVPGGNIGGIGHQHVDPPPQRGGQRLEQIALVHTPTDVGQVAAGAAHRGGIDVRGVQFDPAGRSGHRRPDRARPAAQIHNDGTVHDDGTSPRPRGTTRRPRGTSRRPAGMGTFAGPDRHLGGAAGCLVGQELGAAAGHEYPGFHGYPQPAELRPAEYLLQRQTGHPAAHHCGQVRRGPGLGREKLRLVLGEHTARRPQHGDHGGQ